MVRDASTPSGPAWFHRALIALVLLVVPNFSAAFAQDGPPPAGVHPVDVYYFWGDGCPVCAEQRVFLTGLTERYPDVTVHAFEVWNDAENRSLLEAFSSAYSRPVTGVPVTFIGDDAWVGFNAVAGRQMTASVETYRTYAAPDAADRLPADVRARFLAAAPAAPTAAAATTAPGANVIEIPWVGLVDLTGYSLLVSTLLIAFVDGFNPCSLWVLALLLGVVLNTRKRSKVVLVGLTFLVITATVYGLFIAGLFSVFSYVAYLDWIRALVAGLALAFAAINIKDYFAYKQGLSLSIDDRAKPGIYANIRKIMVSRDSLPATLAATGGMALGVTLVELPCTAGLPVLWTTLLAGADVSTSAFVGLLAVYMAVYLLDELVVFGVAVVTMRIARFEEREGRVLKLIGGSVMLALAIAMLWMPHLLESIGGMLALFGVAIAGAMVVVVAHRLVHPLSSPLTRT